ncbi:hypothetical protein VCHA29O37_50247 [Vibrio chagasii]|nr:hypothetical protein VCHA29O37_50247 [Vibrio chagasii]
MILTHLKLAITIALESLLVDVLELAIDVLSKQDISYIIVLLDVTDSSIDIF